MPDDEIFNIRLVKRLEEPDKNQEQDLNLDLPQNPSKEIEPPPEEKTAEVKAVPPPPEEKPEIKVSSSTPKEKPEIKAVPSSKEKPADKDEEIFAPIPASATGSSEDVDLDIKKKRSSQLAEQSPIQPINRNEFKQRKYGFGCFIFVLITSLLLGTGIAAVIRYKKPIVKKLKSFEKMMSDNGLAHDGGEAPWKSEKENERIRKEKERTKKPKAK